MIGKYFDPLSKLARDASSDNTNVFIGKAGEQIEKIELSLSKEPKTNDENYISR